jgi:hypothetical protein
MKRRQLSILAAVISIFIISCNGAHDQTGDASQSSKLGGGSAAHIDSLKTIGSGVNGESSSTLGAKDTVINGHSVTSPTDSAQKKKP